LLHLAKLYNNFLAYIFLLENSIYRVSSCLKHLASDALIAFLMRYRL